MRILALEPYYGGSHKAFLDGWSSRSRHEWTILGLPAYRWKWRMRHAGYTFAEQLEPRVSAGETWDLLLCSDMVNLPEFLGQAPPVFRTLPTIAYFHENQLTYPDPHATERDLHYGLANLLTALSARAVWFNSRFHLGAFLQGVPGFVDRMPDFPPATPIERIRTKAAVFPQGIDPFPPRPPRVEGPLRILWAARWEHDKDPETFFKSLQHLRTCDIDFRLSVLGQVFNRIPMVFDRAETEFRDRIDHWGYIKNRDTYRSVLTHCDVFVSTAIHEFFGVSAVEAIAAGCFPLLPRRLAYPDLFSTLPGEPPPEEYFYEGGADVLADRLAHLAIRLRARDAVWKGDPNAARRLMERFHWAGLVPRLDKAAEAVAMAAAEPAGPA